MLSGQIEFPPHRGWHPRGDRMLDLGRAEVPMGCGSLEHQCEGKAPGLLATLRPSHTLGQARPTVWRLPVIMRTVQSPSNLMSPKLTSLSRWWPGVLL